MKQIALAIYPHTRPFFIEVFVATMKVLQSLGHDTFESPAPGVASADLEIVFGAAFKHYGIPLWPKRSDRKCIHINWEPLPLNKEQFNEATGRRRNALIELGEVAHQVNGVMHVSRENVEVAKSYTQMMGLDTQHVFLPIGYHESFDHSDLVLPQTNDALFFGLMSDHRKALLNRIKTQINVVETQSLFGEARDRAIAQTKINLNLHVTDHPVSVGVRVPVMFLSSGRFFVSEDLKWWNPFKDGEHYMLWNQEDPDFFRKVLSDEELRTRIGTQGREFLRSEFRYSDLLQKALKELDAL